jgi:hypothetical protein
MGLNYTQQSCKINAQKGFSKMRTNEEIADMRKQAGEDLKEIMERCNYSFKVIDVEPEYK